MPDDLLATAQPAGTVTLVFSDIEGSTRLLESLGTSAYREALAEHRRIVREAYARYQGYEVDYEGDAFFYTFASAHAAVSAVTEAMQGLEPGPIRIRVGIHTGTPELDPPKYVGMDVHTAARIMATGHGGQVVVSETTAALVDTPLQELGEHRLKNIPEAVPLYQLGEGSFPPLKTISNTNLPRPASSFVGRERETQEVVALLSDGARLVTLSGPGGSGKTRLSIEAASELVPEFKAGVFWVGLATLHDPALVTETIGQTLGAKDGLAEHVGERELLLLLDNLEQVVDCAPELGSLLEACPNLKLLCTSRELLRIRGEVEYAVPPLAEPEAVSLFCERSQLEADDTIAELCRRLDNLPLAVELAAARTSVLTPQQILERLSQRLDLLKGGRDSEARQQTLRATIEWSYELLTEDEQQLFARLSVFAGGCTLEAAEEVADADLDTLQSLVDKSLMRFTDGRYWMLETIREYAGDVLNADPQAELLRAAQAHFYAALARQHETGPLLSLSPAAVERFAAEHPNIRDAVSWGLEEENYEMIFALVATVWMAWIVRGHGAEALGWAAAALDRTTGSSETREAALAGGSELARWTGDETRAVAWKEELLALAAEHGLHKPWLRPIVLADLCDIALVNGDARRARRYAEQSLQAAQGDPAAEARARASLGEVALAEGDLEAAYEMFRASAEFFQKRHPFNHAASLEAMGEAARQRGDYEHAAECFGDALRLSAELGDQATVAESLEGMAHCERALGNDARAQRLALLCTALRKASKGTPWRPERALEVPDIEGALAEPTIDEAVEYAQGAD